MPRTEIQLLFCMQSIYSPPELWHLPSLASSLLCFEVSLLLSFESWFYLYAASIQSHYLSHSAAGAGKDEYSDGAGKSWDGQSSLGALPFFAGRSLPWLPSESSKTDQIFPWLLSIDLLGSEVEEEEEASGGKMSLPLSLFAGRISMCYSLLAPPPLSLPSFLKLIRGGREAR